ncbi:unnamed protein product [Gordionus sp. m RMFG-2023]|uniref:uncharacterized protein LOC135928561 n=1 Tax=Gordionus sp. m RMFG-2023 TaxID=3053472 RepID=UPI0030E4F24B
MKLTLVAVILAWNFLITLSEIGLGDYYITSAFNSYPTKDKENYLFSTYAVKLLLSTMLKQGGDERVKPSSSAKNNYNDTSSRNESRRVLKNIQPHSKIIRKILRLKLSQILAISEERGNVSDQYKDRAKREYALNVVKVRCGNTSNQFDKANNDTYENFNGLFKNVSNGKIKNVIPRDAICKKLHYNSSSMLTIGAGFHIELLWESKMEKKVNIPFHYLNPNVSRGKIQIKYSDYLKKSISMTKRISMARQSYYSPLKLAVLEIFPRIKKVIVTKHPPPIRMNKNISHEILKTLKVKRDIQYDNDDEYDEEADGIYYYDDSIEGDYPVDSSNTSFLALEKHLTNLIVTDPAYNNSLPHPILDDKINTSDYVDDMSSIKRKLMSDYDETDFQEILHNKLSQDLTNFYYKKYNISLFFIMPGYKTSISKIESKLAGKITLLKDIINNHHITQTKRPGLGQKYMNITFPTRLQSHLRTSIKSIIHDKFHISTIPLKSIKDNVLDDIYLSSSIYLADKISNKNVNRRKDQYRLLNDNIRNEGHNDTRIIKLGIPSKPMDFFLGIKPFFYMCVYWPTNDILFFGKYTNPHEDE